MSLRLLRNTVRSDPRRQFVLSLVCAVAASLSLYLFGYFAGDGLAYGYLAFNLFLAAIPFALALRLITVLRYKRWSDWEPIGWTLAWLLFLPNSFYMISDYIHLREVPADDILYLSVLFTSFIALGVVLGFCSVVPVHLALRRRMKAASAAVVIGLILFGCSFGIYIGRDLRWNSWDVLVNPGGLLFDISDRLLRPEAYSGMFVTIASFFVLLAALYAVVWSAVRLLMRYK